MFLKGSKNLRTIVGMMILALVVIGLGGTLWVNRAKLGSSASTVSTNYAYPDSSVLRAQAAVSVASAYNKFYFPARPTFSDVPTTMPSYSAIEGLNQAGIMKGYGDGTFRPLATTTRADLTVIVSRAAGIAAYNNPTPSFSDVPKSYWAYQQIEGMKKVGLVNGYPNGTFLPDGAGTRATLASLLYRAKTLSGACSGKVFADVGSTYWACKEMETVAARGWMPYVQPITWTTATSGPVTGGLMFGFSVSIRSNWQKYVENDSSHGIIFYSSNSACNVVLNPQTMQYDDNYCFDHLAIAIGGSGIVGKTSVDKLYQHSMIVKIYPVSAGVDAYVGVNPSLSGTDQSTIFNSFQIIH